MNPGWVKGGILVPSLKDYRILLSEEQSQKRFRQAIRDTVRPGDVVLDLGTGSGLHAFFACQAGAKRVYAVEVSSIIELAKRVASENGFSEKIRFIHGLAQKIELPERVDVVVSYMGFLGTLQNLTDARRRFLKKGGRLIPCAVQFSFVPTEEKRRYRECVDFWSRRRYGMTFRPFRSFAENHPAHIELRTDSFLASPKSLSPISLLQPLARYQQWSLDFKIKKPGLLCGWGGWCSYRLSKDVLLSPRPPLRFHPKLWSHLFLPLQKPVRVKAGQRVQVELGLYLSFSNDGPQGELWKWNTRVGDNQFHQSSFQSIPLSRELLKRAR